MLELHYGNPTGEEWSPKHVERCYVVLLTLLERQIGGDNMIYYQPNYFGALYGPRKHVINRIFRLSDMTICSYDPTAEKPVSIVKIIKDDLEYKKFCDFWNKIPTCRQLQEVLCRRFPKDIANIIIEMSANLALQTATLSNQILIGTSSVALGTSSVCLGSSSIAIGRGAITIG